MTAIYERGEVWTARSYERIGITGSRHGATEKQLRRLAKTLIMLKAERGAKFFHHGDCVGVDREAAVLAQNRGYVVIGHPPIDDGLRAFFLSDEERPANGYLARDRELVDEVDLMLALPNSFEPRPRSGTWYTIKYAESTGTNVAVILPDGRWRR